MALSFLSTKSEVDKTRLGWEWECLASDWLMTMLIFIPWATVSPPSVVEYCICASTCYRVRSLVNWLSEKSIVSTLMNVDDNYHYKICNMLKPTAQWSHGFLGFLGTAIHSKSASWLQMIRSRSFYFFFENGSTWYD